MMGHCVTLGIVWSPNEATLQRHYERVLSQVGTHPGMTLDVARI